MPRFTPFPAIRYTATDLHDLVAPPYDVLSDADLDVLQACSPHNITHVDVPRESWGPGRYEAAAARLDSWLAAGVMAVDPEPSYTLYRLDFTDATDAPRRIVGVLGGLEVVDEGAGGVLPHERVTPKASTDRLDLTRATRANLSPVWGLSLAAGLTSLLAAPGEHLATVELDGVVHRVERVTDPDRVDAVRAAIATDDVLIADGHHRYGVARRYRDERRAAGVGSADAGPAEDTLAFVSELVADQLSVEAIHRLYADVAWDDLTRALDRSFELVPTDPPSPATLRTMEARGALYLVGPGGRHHWLEPRPGAFADERALDGAWLERALDDVPHTVRYQHGLGAVVEAVAAGTATAGVLIRPVGVAEIERTAREGLLMPPKSTFFTPKLLTGLVLRSLR